jgi:hypothetical protein
VAKPTIGWARSSLTSVRVDDSPRESSRCIASCPPGVERQMQSLNAAVLHDRAQGNTNFEIVATVRFKRLASAIKRILGLARGPRSSPPYSRCRSRCGSALPTGAIRALHPQISHRSSRRGASAKEIVSEGVLAAECFLSCFPSDICTAGV